MFRNSLLTTVAAFGVLSVRISAQTTVFSESFESPSVTGYKQNTGPASGWIKGNVGYGSQNHGLYNVDTAAFSTPFGSQAYMLNYTNSGLTTSGDFGVVVANMTYTVSFNAATESAVNSNQSGHDNYRIELVGFDSGDNRADTKSTSPAGTILAISTGQVTTGDMSHAVSFSFTPGAGHASIGKSLAIRLRNTGTNNALIDNLKLVVAAPPVDTTSPTMIAMSPMDNASDQGIYTNLVATFDEDVALSGSGSITIKKLSDTSGASDVTITLPDSQVSVSGASLTINPAYDLASGTDYAVQISGDALQDKATTPNLYVGIADDSTWNFSTEIITDTDADGLDDDWEIAHFGSITAQDGFGDDDGDGYYNVEEASFGTDPNVAGGIPGYLAHDVWLDIGGTTVGDLVNNSKFHQASPDVRELIPGSESYFGLDNYGDRLRGTVKAPVTGSYNFWVAGDDGVELWLSSDDRKFNRRRIAWHNGLTNQNQWDKYGTQKSAPVQLVAGQKYYIEMLHKESHGRDHVSIAWSYEASDLTNLAREPGAVASQSTTSNGGDANRAVDGATDGSLANQGITFTDTTTDGNWWQIDLGTDRDVERIILHNRTEDDGSKQRLSNFRVSVLDANGSELYGQDYHTVTGYVEASLTIDLPTVVKGRKVKVTLLGANLFGDKALVMSEVEVIGSLSGQGSGSPLTYLTNWTQQAGVNAIQSTTQSGKSASRAVDGNRNGLDFSGSVSQTATSDSNSWWQVDLGATRPVSRVVVYNRTDQYASRLSNIRIILQDGAGANIAQQDFYEVEGYAEYQLTWDVPYGLTAQKVKIERLGPARDGSNVLAFAEVEVLGMQGMVAGGIQARIPVPPGVLESFYTDMDDPDDDGLPSAWETQYGFDPASKENSGGGSFGDPDGDMLLNWQEYQMGTDPTVATPVDGALSEEVWTGIPGKDLDDLHNNPKYLLGANYRRLISTSEGTRWLGNDTGTRIRGYLTPTLTGNYSFKISGSTEVAFWFSMGESKFYKELLINPNLETGFHGYNQEPSQRSRTVHLVAGQKYYLELQHKEQGGGGGSPVSLIWLPPVGNASLIPAGNLSTYVRETNDQDDDDLPDDWEAANGLSSSDNGSINPANGYNGDLDGDGLSNYRESVLGTRADLADTDGDGISDYDEAEVLESDALAGDVAPFANVQTIDGSGHTASEGGWAADGLQAYTTGARGWVEYQISVPSAGTYLLDFAVSPRSGGALSAEYEMEVSVDGNFNERVAATIAEGESGNIKSLTPWLAAGTHIVRLFNDNALTYRTINIHSLSVLSAQGGDANSNGTPDWVEARLSRINGIESQSTTSRVSPVCVEGRARSSHLVNLPNGGQVTALAGDRWTTDLALDSSAAVNFQANFENGGLVENHSFTWVSTNLLAETSITLRQGDSLLLTGYNGVDPLPSETVTLVVNNQTNTFVANSPLEYRFDTPGTQSIAVSVNDAGQITTNNVTVAVVAPLTIDSPVCVNGYIREWEIPELPAGLFMEIDSLIDWRGSSDLGGGTMRHYIGVEAPRTFCINIRVGEDGPILQTIPVLGMSVRDSGQTSVRYAQDYGDGSYQVDMPLVVTGLQTDIRVHYDIVIGGVVFDTGGITKDYLPTDFDSLGQAMVTFIKTGTLGAACHRTSVWQGSKRIAFFQ